MKTLRLILDLMRARPLLTVVNMFIWLLGHSTPLLTGLLMREFFNRLSGEDPAGWNLWTKARYFIGCWVQFCH